MRNKNIEDELQHFGIPGMKWGFNKGSSNGKRKAKDEDEEQTDIKEKRIVTKIASEKVIPEQFIYEQVIPQTVLYDRSPSNGKYKKRRSGSNKRIGKKFVNEYVSLFGKNRIKRT